MASSRQSDGGAVDSKSQDIYSQALECKNLLRKYVVMSTPYCKRVSTYEQRFLTWASFLGVFASENACLDRRLEFSPEIKELVLAMLLVLKRNLERILVLRSPTYFESSDPVLVENDGAMYGITGAIDRLHRLAVVIRQSPRTNEVDRVRIFASKQEPDGFPSLISAIVQFLFPDAERTLHAQLVESIVYRRSRMLWSWRHSKKLSQERKPKHENELAEPKISAPKEESPSEKGVLSPLPQHQVHSKPVAGTIYSSTIPSRVPLRKMSSTSLHLPGSPNEDASSVRSSNPPPRAQYPEIPDATEGERNRSCPYCLINIEISSDTKKANKDWINHLNTDLRPYVCISEACKDFPIAFQSTREWHAHMDNNHGAEWPRYIHRVKWRCPFCGEDEGLFSTEDLLVRHLEDLQIKKHPRLLDEFELQRIKPSCKVTRRREPDCCPLTLRDWRIEEDEKASEQGSSRSASLKAHLVRHLEQLAILSISWWAQDIGAIAEHTMGSNDGSDDATRLNSQIDTEEERLTGAVYFLDDDTLGEFERTRESEESLGAQYQLELSMQQQELWELLKQDFHYVGRLEYERIEHKVDWKDASSQRDLFKRLENLQEQFRLDAEAVIPQQARLEKIIGSRVEPPATLDSVIPIHNPERDDNTAVNHMMRIQTVVQEILPSLESIEIQGYDNVSLSSVIRSRANQAGPWEGNVPDDLNEIFTDTFIQTFFRRLVSKVSSLADEDKESIVRYCTNEVQHPRVYYSPETKKEKLASRQKLFAISTLMQTPAMIIFFIRHDICDLELPFHEALFRPNHIQCQSGRQIRLSGYWTDERLTKFLDCQNTMFDTLTQKPIGLKILSALDIGHDPPVPRQSGFCCIPLSKNAHFVGRDEVLTQLRSLLFEKNSQQVILTGTAGTGKAQVALQLAFWVKENKSDYSVFWVSAHSEAVLEQGCVDIIKTLGIRCSKGQTAIQAMRQHLDSKRSGKWLLVIVDADTSHGQALNRLPRNFNGRVLLTTQSYDVTDAAGRVVNLREMNVEDASRLLEKSLLSDGTPRNDELSDGKTVVSLLSNLENLPLAIVQAAAYIKTSETSIAEYSHLIKGVNSGSIMNLLNGKHEFNPTVPITAVATTWTLSFNHILRSDPLVASVLSFLIFIEPKAIPLSILPLLETEQQTTQALAILLGHGFLTQRAREATFDMHSLVHFLTRTFYENADNWNEMHQAALRRVIEVFPTDDWKNHEVWRQYLPHALKLLTSIKKVGSEDMCQLGHSIIRCLLADGRAEDAIDTLHAVDAIQKRILEEDHPLRLALLHEFSRAYQARGLIRNAEDILKFLVLKQRKVFGEDHPSRLASLHELARTYLAQGRITEAKELLESVVVLRGQILGEDHTLQLASLYELASAYEAENRRNEAIQILQHVVTVEAGILTENDPRRQRSKDLLQRCYEKMANNA